METTLSTKFNKTDGVLSKWVEMSWTTSKRV